MSSVEPLQENATNKNKNQSPAQIYQTLISPNSTQDQVFAAVQASR